MNINKYHNTGIGLSRKSLEILETNMLSLYKSKNFTSDNPMRIVEFGSGFSTQFLVDFVLHYKLNVEIDSFDNSKLYCYKNTQNHKFLNLYIRKLLHCSNSDYKIMFDNKKYIPNLMIPYTKNTSYRQQNCFYDIQENDLKDNYDVMLLDGPNGNGRNFSYLYLQHRMSKDGLIFIDDIDHYDFEPKMKLFFNTTTKFKLLGDDKQDKWNGGRIGLFKIL